MPKTRRDLLLAMRQKILNAAAGNPELAQKIKEHLPDDEGAAIEALGLRLDEPISDAEYERQLSALDAMTLRRLADSRRFPSPDKATMDGRN